MRSMYGLEYTGLRKTTKNHRLYDLGPRFGSFRSVATALFNSALPSLKTEKTGSFRSLEGAKKILNKINYL